MIDVARDQTAPRAESAPADLVIPVAGHVLDYRDTAEIAGIVRLMQSMGFVPWAEYRAQPSIPRNIPGGYPDPNDEPDRRIR